MSAVTLSRKDIQAALAKGKANADKVAKAKPKRVRVSERQYYFLGKAGQPRSLIDAKVRELPCCLVGPSSLHANGAAVKQLLSILLSVLLLPLPWRVVTILFSVLLCRCLAGCC